VSDYRRLFAEKQEVLVKLFSTFGVVAEPLEKILGSTFKGLPRAVAIIGLRDIMGRVRIKHKSGILGTLILQNGYIVFQPDKVTDRAIPLALRYGRAYSRKGRSVSPPRGTLFQVGAPVKPVERGAPAEEKAPDEIPEEDVADENTLRKSAIASLTGWNRIVERIMAEPDAVIEPPAGMKKERFYGLRWLYTHFGNLEETPLIAARWWMDNIWTFAERNAVLADWVTRFDSLRGDEADWVKLYIPNEVYNGKIRGFLIYDPKTRDVKNYCFTKKDGKRVLDICPSTFDADVATLVAPPVDREDKEATGDVFGFLATVKHVVVFKTVHKPSSKGRLTGAECDNDSNVLHHHPRVLSAMEALARYAPKDPILTGEMLLPTESAKAPSKIEKKEEQKGLKLKYEGKSSEFEEFSHLYSLSLLQVCPYLEFLLRYMDMKKVGDRRWFLSIVDSVRALPGGEKRIEMT
jgi:hypothetical protein